MLHPVQAPAPASSAKTSIRSAHEGALATSHEWKFSNMSGAMIAVVVCSNVVPVLGAVVALAIYAIYQNLNNDAPQKQKQLFEEACNEAFAKIELNADNQKTMTYRTSNGCTVTYTEKPDGLYLRKSFNGIKEDEEKHHFKTLAQLQKFRRADLSLNADPYKKICPEDLKPLLRTATLDSKLSQHVGSRIEDEVLTELKALHSLVPKDIEAASACLMGVEKNTNIDGLQLKKLAILHNTLSKIGSDHNVLKIESEVFGEEALKNFMDVYNLENAYQSKADEFRTKTGLEVPSTEKLKELCDLNLVRVRGDSIGYDKFLLENNLTSVQSDELVKLYGYQKHEVTVEAFRALPELEPESIKIMLDIEKEFNPANITSTGELTVSDAVTKLVHDTFRPGETGDESELVEIRIDQGDINFTADEVNPIQGDIKFTVKQTSSKVAVTADEVNLLKDLNSGDFSLGTSFRMISCKEEKLSTKEVRVATYGPIPAPLKYALCRSYKNSDSTRQSTNPTELHKFIELHTIYTTNKPKYDLIFSKVYAKCGTLNIYDGDNARNGLFL